MIYMSEATNNEDQAGLKGHVELQKRPAGSESEDDWETFHEQDNLIPDAGLNKYRDLIKGEHSSNISQFCYGTDGTAEAAGDTDLGNQVHIEPWDGDNDTATGEVQWTGKLDSVEPANQPHDIAEFGVKFEDGTLASRITFPAETKDNSQEWRVRYTLTLSNA